MLNIRTTETFDAWFDGLKDRIAKRRIQARVGRLVMGTPATRIPQARRLPNCGSITVVAIASTTCSAAQCW
jgi:hypothetical protein